MRTIEIVHDSVVMQKTDAIVNAANSTLMGGGGVDGAIHDAAGDRLYWYFHELGCTCQPGEAIESPGFNLPAKHIIHTVGPIWHEGRYNEAKTLEACYKNCLDEAVKHSCRSIAFCCISVGVYRYPLEPATRIALKTVDSWLKDYSGDLLVRFCCYSDEEFEVYKRTAADLGLVVSYDCKPIDQNAYLSPEDLNDDLCRFLSGLESLNAEIARVFQRFCYMMCERRAGHVIRELDGLADKVQRLKYFLIKGIAGIPGARFVPGWSQGLAAATKSTGLLEDMKRHGVNKYRRFTEEQKKELYGSLSRISNPKAVEEQVLSKARQAVYRELGISPEDRLLRFVEGFDDKVVLVWEEKAGRYVCCEKR